MADLAEVHGGQYRQDLYNLGVAVSMGFNAPKELKSLLKRPDEFVTNDMVTGMLKIPKKKNNG